MNSRKNLPRLFTGFADETFDSLGHSVLPHLVSIIYLGNCSMLSFIAFVVYVCCDKRTFIIGGLRVSHGHGQQNNNHQQSKHQMELHFDGDHYGEL